MLMLFDQAAHEFADLRSCFGHFVLSFCCCFSVVATQTFKLPLRVVQFAFEKMEHERDVDEIECLLANLIFRVSELVQHHACHAFFNIVREAGLKDVDGCS